MMIDRMISLGGYNVELMRVIVSGVFVVATFFIVRSALRWMRDYESQHGWSDSVSRRNNFRLSLAIILCMGALVLIVLKIDPEITNVRDHQISLSDMMFLIATLLVSFIADSFISQRIEEEVKANKSGKPFSNQGTHRSKSVVNYIMGLLFAYTVLRSYPNLNPRFLLKVKDESEIYIQLSDVILAIMIIMIARLLIWFTTQVLMKSIYRRNGIDSGKQFAYNRLLTYLAYFFAIVLALQSLGINMTLLLTGAAALLVGIGIALQQTISDFFSGIVLLFERSVEVGDFVQTDSVSGVLTQIGLRSSHIRTVENKTIVLPNSQLVNGNVTNWSHEVLITRFSVKVGVAYGSDTQLVKKLLLESVKDCSEVVSFPAPNVRFQNFGDSSLDFELFFFSDNVWLIDNVRSDIRMEIDRLFRENNISIPFPQRDVWIRKEE